MNSALTFVYSEIKMAPAKFGDLGKEAKDLINKNFHFGVIKFEGKTKTKNGVVRITHIFFNFNNSMHRLLLLLVTISRLILSLNHDVKIRS